VAGLMGIELWVCEEKFEFSDIFMSNQAAGLRKQIVDFIVFHLPKAWV
jgi:hypothetical protein